VTEVFRKKGMRMRAIKKRAEGQLSGGGKKVKGNRNVPAMYISFAMEDKNLRFQARPVPGSWRRSQSEKIS